MSKIYVYVLFTLCFIVTYAFSNTADTFPKQNELRYKIAQMLILGFDGYQLTPKSPITKTILNEELGGIILFDYNYKTKKFEKT